MIKLYVAIIGKSQLFKFIGIKIEDEDKNEIYKEINESTSNRAIIMGIESILSEMKDKSEICVFVPTNFGFKYMEKLSNDKEVGKWINKDVGLILDKTIKDKNLIVKYSDYGDEENSKFIKSLKQKLKNKYDNKNIIRIYDNKIFNKNEIQKSEVKFYVRGITDFSTKERISKYFVIMHYNGVEKEIYKDDINSTPNRMIIQGVIDGIKNLKKPCHIKLHIHTSIGLLKFSKDGGGANKDMIEKLFDFLKRGNHSLEEIICDDRQVELVNKLFIDNIKKKRA